MWIPAIITTIGIFVCMGHRSLEKDHGRYISVKEIEETETKLRGA
jgi:cytochrome aa3-600 menaquinol oxidase subunit 1